MISYWLIGITGLLSLYALSNEETFRKLAFIPYLIKRDKSEYFRFVSHGFIHGGIGHLAFNMLTLYFFGPILEKRVMSPFEFVLFYILAMIVGTVSAYQKNKDNPEYLAVGASGAVSAVLFALVFYYPWEELYLYFAIPVYFVLFAFGYLFYSWWMQKKGSQDRVAHDVHLYGALFGISYILITHPDSLRIFINSLLNPPW